LSLSYPYTTPSLLGLLHTAVQALVQGKHSLLSSIHLRISSLSTGEHIPTNQVRDEDIFFVTQPIRVSMHTATFASVAPGFNPKTAVLPRRAVN
jgi:hypothetical protein